MWVKVSVRVQSSAVIIGVAVGILVVLGATGVVCVCTGMVGCSYGCTYTKYSFRNIRGSRARGDGASVDTTVRGRLS